MVEGGQRTCKDFREEQRGRRRLKRNTWHKGKGWSWVLLGKEEGTKALSGVVEQMAITVWAGASREHY